MRLTRAKSCASGQARHALRRAHIKAAAGDANATTNAMAQAAEQQTRRCQFAAHGMRGEARLIFPAIALKLPWGRPHVVLDLMDISSHEPHRWLAVEDHVAAEGVGRAEKL